MKNSLRKDLPYVRFYGKNKTAYLAKAKADYFATQKLIEFSQITGYSICYC